MLCVLIFIHKGGTYSLKSIPNDRFFEKLFRIILFTEFRHIYYTFSFIFRSGGYDCHYNDLTFCSIIHILTIPAVWIVALYKLVLKYWKSRLQNCFISIFCNFLSFEIPSLWSTILRTRQ